MREAGLSPMNACLAQRPDLTKPEETEHALHVTY